MARRKPNDATTSALKVDDVRLSDAQLRTLAGIMKDLNGGITNPEDVSDTGSALADCAIRYLDEREQDYLPNSRPILHGAAPQTPLVHFEATPPTA